jgi:hypothetical protein
VKPAVGFTLPSAGLSPAPGIKRKMRDFVPVRKRVGGIHLSLRGLCTFNISLHKKSDGCTKTCD